DLKDKYLIEDEKVTPMEGAYDVKTYDIFASRGCPSNCTYCMACHWDRMYEKYGCDMPKIRLRSVESVIDELLFAKEEYDIENVRFMDSIFGFNRKWLFEFLDAYDEKIGLKFSCHLDERYIDEERIERLSDSGINFTTVGIQSTNREIRHEIMKRNISDDGLVEYAEMLVNNGIKLKYDIIGWNPFETNETLREGVDFLKRLPKGERTVVFQLKMFPGAPICSLYEEKQPIPLADNEYEYWAWIYQMILRSEETGQIADFALKYEFFKDNPRILKNLFNEADGKLTAKDKIFAARGIKKGKMVTRVMLEPRKSADPGGVFFNDRHRILSKVACRDIREGSIVSLEDFFGAYQNVGGGNF
ncbi:MAG: radical SAM protein, partial [Planctomycetes bacterium]|nr:radical SAM protein [Planctomycetota bacterium]